MINSYGFSGAISVVVLVRLGAALFRLVVFISRHVRERRSLGGGRALHDRIYRVKLHTCWIAYKTVWHPGFQKQARRAHGSWRRGPTSQNMG